MAFYGFSFKIINVIRSLNAKAEYAVRINGIITDWFQITAGLRQGCLSPVLFNIFLEFVMSHVLEEIGKRRKGVSIGGRIQNLGSINSKELLPIMLHYKQLAL